MDFAKLSVFLFLLACLLLFAGCAIRNPPPLGSAMSWDAGLKPQFLRVGDVSVRYIEAGEGPTVVLLHTLRTQLDMYQRVIPALSEDFRVIALDYPGHGYSDIPDATYDAAFFRRFVTDALAALELDNVILVGESIGGALALQLAGQPNPRLAAVVALNPYDYAQGRGLARSSMIARVLVPASQIPGVGEFAMWLRPPFVVNSVLKGGLQDPKSLPADLRRELNRIQSRPGYSRAFLSLLRHSDSWEADRQFYSETDLPVMIVWGEDDWSTEEERMRSAKPISNAQVQTIPDAGHFLSLDAPEAVIAAVQTAHAELPSFPK